MTRSDALVLTRLTLTDFRNYAALRLDCAGSPVVLVGPNGAGKTNLLEAISLLAPGRGLRGAGLEEPVRMGSAGSWAIAAELATPAGQVRLGTAWSGQSDDAEPSSRGRVVLVDGHLQKSSGALADHVRLIWLTPAMDRLFAGPAGERRRFLDRLVSVFDPEHGSRVLVFEKLMRERNALLQEPRSDAAWFASLEVQMAEAAVAIAAARKSAVDRLQGHIFAARGGGAFPWGELSVEGELEGLLSGAPAVQVEDEYRRILLDSRALDRASGRTSRGPHRSDFAVVHGPKSMPAERCSTGEQKALLIGLILAQARAVKQDAGMAPLLLLDEVGAHLDRHRREQALAALGELGSQAWVTGTEEGVFAGLTAGARVFHVEAGSIEETRKE